MLTQLKRYPHRPQDTLQAFDSADELILNHLATLDLKDKRILIINDAFGALGISLIQYSPTLYTDSFVSSMGVKVNSQNRLEPLSDLSKLNGLYDYVLIKLPKNMSFLEDILCHLSKHMHLKSQVICGGMIKHMAPTAFTLLNKYIGQTSTSLATKKARLIFANFEKNQVSSPYPQEVKLDGFEFPFTNHSNLFSRDKLDIGSRFFLEHIPKGSFENILDLGCANGVIGIKAKMLNSQAKIHFSDESQMAILSTRENYKKYFNDEAEFYWTNCFENQKKDLLDLVLCNPPFHQSTTIGDFIAWQMFQDAYDSLKEGGQLRVIGNSHLGYQVKLKKIFGKSKIVETNNKFIICESYK